MNRPLRGPLCPVDPSHGVLVDWPTDRWAYHCIHQAHDGWKERPATRSFFTTPEAETGLLIETPRPSGEPAVIPAAPPQRTPVASRTHELPGAPLGLWESAAVP